MRGLNESLDVGELPGPALSFRLSSLPRLGLSMRQRGGTASARGSGWASAASTAGAAGSVPKSVPEEGTR